MTVEDTEAGTVIQPSTESNGVILYVHGAPEGGHERATALRLAELTGASVVCPSYRSMFPVAFEDVRAAYRRCKPAGRVSLVGERMGAGLAAALLVYLRDLGASLPRCAVLVSGLLDLTMRANSLMLNARAEPTLDVTQIKQLVSDYAGAATLTNPLLSPLYANLHGLAPVQLLVAGTDPLLDDSLGFAARAARSGVEVDLRVSRDAAALAATMVEAAASFIRQYTPAAALAA